MDLDEIRDLARLGKLSCVALAKAVEASFSDDPCFCSMDYMQSNELKKKKALFNDKFVDKYKYLQNQVKNECFVPIQSKPEMMIDIETKLDLDAGQLRYLSLNVKNLKNAISKLREFSKIYENSPTDKNTKNKLED